jgi:ABC-2 type transport system permease protein
MSTAPAFAYTRFELKRTLRNRRFLLFSFLFPVLLYLLVAGPNKHDENLQGTGLSAPLYFMVSMASWGTMTSVLSVGGRIAGERKTGWNRQLRISPLTAPAYLRAKVVTSYAMAVLSLVVLYALGVSFGVRLPAGQWVGMTALILVGLIPFAALGITMGHLLTVDTIGPVIGGGTSLLALLSGTWFPLGDSGFVHDLAQGLPSYWLVQANRVALGGGGWPLTGWLVVLGWGGVLALSAAYVFRRDTARG